MTYRWIAILAAGLCGCSAASDRPAESPRPAQAVRVLSGDMLDVGGQTVRLANAQAPALPPQARCWSEAALAVQAAAKTEALVAEAGSVTVTPQSAAASGTPDLAHVALDGRRDLGEALIFAGLAARRTAATWDWCGPADFHRADGPGFDKGPQSNSAFMAWVATEQDRQLNESLARLLMEGGPSLEAFDGS